VRTPERNYGSARLPGGAVVTPLARRLAGEAGIDLANVKGSGPHGRIVARDVAQAHGAKAPSPAVATPAQIALTADLAIAEPLALCRDVDGLSLADVIVKAWAMALRRAMPDAPADIGLAGAKDPVLIANATTRSLTAIAAARREATEGAQRAATGIFIAEVPGIASVAHAVRPPQTTMLSIGSCRRAAAEAADGSVVFVETVTATLACDPAAVDASLGAELLSTFKGFVERPVTMLV
jgi:pyruvate dehydrogenase E2 component (dihydrolipoamide acetyltransferase)